LPSTLSHSSDCPSGTTPIDVAGDLTDLRRQAAQRAQRLGDLVRRLTLAGQDLVGARARAEADQARHAAEAGRWDLAGAVETTPLLSSARP
jgi:hypothetical protein